MNWEMLAAIGQLAAVVVGIPSLIYLALQIRAQTKERRQSAVNALTVRWGDLTYALHDNAEFGAIYLRGVQSFDDLDAVSKLRFSAFFNRFLKNFQAMCFAHQDGMLADQYWGEIERTMTDVIGYPGVQQWWKTRRHWHTRNSPIWSMQLSPKARSRKRTQLTISPMSLPVDRETCMTQK